MLRAVQLTPVPAYLPDAKVPPKRAPVPEASWHLYEKAGPRTPAGLLDQYRLAECRPLREAITAASRPVLIIAGGAVPDELAAARWFQAASHTAIRVWVALHAGHIAALAAQPRAWEEQVTSFLNAALDPSTLAAAPGARL